MEMPLKWYEHPLSDKSVAISARVRFARNFENYPFPLKLRDADAVRMMRETAETLPEGYKFFDITDSPPGILLPLMERHIISNQMVGKKGVKGVITDAAESVSIMLNEEDHARIQSIYPGDNIERAFGAANELDSLIDAKGVNKYAFSYEYGYLTACPTNAGTGMRASFMLHLPMLEATHFINKLLPALGKFGMTVRGIHGEGSESIGAVYQLSNQITLGKPEHEILTALKNAATQVIHQENAAREKLISENRLYVEDKLYRSYGILKHCRTLDLEEGMSLLSDVRLGFLSGLFDGSPNIKPPKKTIYNLMMDIQPGNITHRAGKPLTSREINILRAEYIADQLKF